MHALDFILQSFKLKYLLNFICDLNEKAKWLIWNPVFSISI